MYKYAVENFGRNMKEWQWKNLEIARITEGVKHVNQKAWGKNPPQYMKNFLKKFFDFENFEIKI